MKKLLIFAAIALTWTACGGKKKQTENADVAVSDSIAKAEIVGVIDSLYAVAARNEGDIDGRFACHSWREMIQAVNQKDSQLEEIGFFNEDYWTEMQDSNPDQFETRDIQFEQLDVEKGRAEVSFLLHSSIQDVKRRLAFCREDGSWRIHDITKFYNDPDGKEVAYSYRESMKNYLNESAEETGEDDDFIEQTLPNTAVQKDENAEIILYTNLDIAATEDSNSQTSVWMKYKKSGKVRFLFNTNNDAKPRWEEMKDGNGITVPIEDIAAGECDNCRLIPWDKDKIFVEGCPDSRNIWSYIYDIRNQNAVQLPSTEGLLDIDAANRLFNMSLYRYHPEGGRYSVKRSYTIDGKYTGKEQVLED